MALKLTRHAGTVVYGGWNLDPENLEQSYDHRIWVRMVRWGDIHDALLNVSVKDARVEEHILTVGGDELSLDEDVSVCLEHVKNYEIKESYCQTCHRGGDKQRVIPQASFAFSAPRAYRIIRDDVIKKYESTTAH
tara:strand:+ start:527 stop:931 length:405 start_codon:yes stop_codon:yes gene_type:complete